LRDTCGTSFQKKPDDTTVLSLPVRLPGFPGGPSIDDEAPRFFPRRSPRRTGTIVLDRFASHYNAVPSQKCHRAVRKESIFDRGRIPVVGHIMGTLCGHVLPTESGHYSVIDVCCGFMENPHPASLFHSLHNTANEAATKIISCSSDRPAGGECRSRSTSCVCRRDIPDVSR